MTAVLSLLFKIRIRNTAFQILYDSANYCYHVDIFLFSTHVKADKFFDTSEASNSKVRGPRVLQCNL